MATARRASPVERVLAEGRDMLFDVDWQGAKQVRERLGDVVVQHLRSAAVDVGIARSPRTAGRRRRVVDRCAFRKREARD